MSDTIYIRLLDEGNDVWRPVGAARLSESVYQIADQTISDDESWEFQPGAVVRVEHRVFRDHEEGLVAVALAAHA